MLATTHSMAWSHADGSAHVRKTECAMIRSVQMGHVFADIELSNPCRTDVEAVTELAIAAAIAKLLSR